MEKQLEQLKKAQLELEQIKKAQPELEQIEAMLSVLKKQVEDIDKDITKQLESNIYNVDIEEDGKQVLKGIETRVGYTELQNHSRELIKQYCAFLALKLQIKKVI